MSHRDGEQGFVLMAAMWLLILGAALVALMMVKTRSSAKEAYDAARFYQAELDARSAVETVGAELLIQGGGSRWSLLPANGTVDVGGRSVQVGITSEAGRMDLAKADPIQIDAVLRGLGYSAQVREVFVTDLKAKRSADTLHSYSDEQSLLAQLGGQAVAACPADLFTVASGASSPEFDRAPEPLLKALGIPATPGGAHVRAGEPLRISIGAAAAPRLFVIRIGLQGGEPVDISEAVNRSAPCA